MNTDEKPNLTFRNLRLVNSRLLAHYLLQRPHLLNTWRWVNLSDGDHSPVALGQDQVVYHSWLPGFLVVHSHAAGRIQELIAGQATPDSSEDHCKICSILQRLGWCEDVEIDLGSLIERVQREFFAWQNPMELREFLTLIKKKRPKAVLEIGTFAGGVLYCLSQLADPEATLISLDTQGLPYGGGQTNMECELFRSFGPPAQKFEFIRNRSFHYTSVKNLEKILDGRKLDVLFIDADHSYGAVKSDFEMYKDFVAEDGLIAFHDICAFPTSLEEWRYGNEVAVLWKELTEDYETRTIVDPNPLLAPSKSCELFESRWPALGIGVVIGNRPVKNAPLKAS